MKMEILEDLLGEYSVSVGGLRVLGNTKLEINRPLTLISCDVKLL